MVAPIQEVISILHHRVAAPCPRSTLGSLGLLLRVQISCTSTAPFSGQPLRACRSPSNFPALSSRSSKGPTPAKVRFQLDVALWWPFFRRSQTDINSGLAISALRPHAFIHSLSRVGEEHLGFDQRRARGSNWVPLPCWFSAVSSNSFGFLFRPPCCFPVIAHALTRKSLQPLALR